MFLGVVRKDEKLLVRVGVLPSRQRLQKARRVSLHPVDVNSLAPSSWRKSTGEAASLTFGTAWPWITTRRWRPRSVRKSLENGRQRPTRQPARLMEQRSREW